MIEKDAIKDKKPAPDNWSAGDSVKYKAPNGTVPKKEVSNLMI